MSKGTFHVQDFDDGYRAGWNQGIKKAKEAVEQFAKDCGYPGGCEELLKRLRKLKKM